MLIKDQRGIGSILEIIIVAVVVVLIGVVGFKVNQIRTNARQSIINSKSTDPTVNWTTYNSANEPLSFKYPSDWKMDPTPPSSDGMAGDTVKLTSPTGFTLVYNSSAGGFGGGCGPDCPDVQTYKLTPVSGAHASTPIFVAEGSIKGNDKTDTQNYNQYIPTLGLIGKTDLGDVPKIGELLGVPPYYLVFPKKNTKTVGFVMFEFELYPSQGSSTSKWHYTKDNIQDFFSQPDVQTGRLILQSLKY